VRAHYCQTVAHDDDGDGGANGWANPHFLGVLALGCDAVPWAGSVSSAGKVARKQWIQRR
jgi:hypothetical protein